MGIFEDVLAYVSPGYAAVTGRWEIYSPITWLFPGMIREPTKAEQAGWLIWAIVALIVIVAILYFVFVR